MSMCLYKLINTDKHLLGKQVNITNAYALHVDVHQLHKLKKHNYVYNMEINESNKLNMIVVH